MDYCIFGLCNWELGWLGLLAALFAGLVIVIGALLREGLIVERRHQYRLVKFKQLLAEMPADWLIQIYDRGSDGKKLLAMTVEIEGDDYLHEAFVEVVVYDDQWRVSKRRKSPLPVLEDWLRNWNSSRLVYDALTDFVFTEA